MAWISFGALPSGGKTWWELASRCCWNRARPWHASGLVSFLVGLMTYQHSGNILPIYDMKAYRGTRCIDPLIFNYGMRRSEWHLHVPAAFALEHKSGTYWTRDWVSPREFLYFFFQYQAWKKLLSRYWLQYEYHQNIINSWHPGGHRNEFNPTCIYTTHLIKQCRRKKRGRLHPLADSYNAYKVATEFSLPCQFPLSMLNATGIPSHHLKLLWLDQLEDYGIGCVFVSKRLDR